MMHKQTSTLTKLGETPLSLLKKSYPKPQEKQSYESTVRVLKQAGAIEPTSDLYLYIFFTVIVVICVLFWK
jgi:hypothetical protein